MKFQNNRFSIEVTLNCIDMVFFLFLEKNTKFRAPGYTTATKHQPIATMDQYAKLIKGLTFTCST